MAVAAQFGVLGFHDARQRAHQHAAFAGEVAVDFHLERRRKEEARSDGDAQRQRPLHRAAGRILVHGKTGVDAAAVEEIAPDGRSGAFRRDHDHVDEVRRNDARLILVNDGKAVRKVKRVSFFQMRFDFGPQDHLRRVGNQILNDGGFLHRLFDREERLAGNPAVGDGLVPVRLVFRRLPDDDMNAVVFHVEGLCGTLYAVSQNGDHFIFKHLLRFFHRKFFRGHHIFDRAAKIDFCHKTPCYKNFLIGC